MAKQQLVPRPHSQASERRLELGASFDDHPEPLVVDKDELRFRVVLEMKFRAKLV